MYTHVHIYTVEENKSSKKHMRKISISISIEISQSPQISFLVGLEAIGEIRSLFAAEV
jgi:hypothetical protein